MLIRPATMAKAHGVQPGATLRENPPVSHRYRLSPVKPKNCMSISVRNAPMRREEKRAEKSATPQPNDADIPRRMSKEFFSRRGASDVVDAGPRLLDSVRRGGLRSE